MIERSAPPCNALLPLFVRPPYCLGSLGTFSGARFMAIAATVFLVIVMARGTALGASGGFDLASLEEKAPLLGMMDYLPDSESNLTWQTALAVEGWQPLTLPRLGYLRHPIWTRVEVVNSSPLPRTVILYNQRPLLAHLTVFVLAEDELLEQRELGFFEPRDPRRDTIHRLSNMPVTLAPGESRTILARLDTRGLMEADWIASSEAAFARKSQRELMILGLYCGIMLALMGQMLFFWQTYRKPWFLILAGYALCFLLYMLIIHGGARLVDPGIPPQTLVAAAGTFIFMAVLCLIAFSISILDMA
ncbi:7TM-DISM domain-containing protein [Desulfonatronum parangueonense]